MDVTADHPGRADALLAWPTYVLGQLWRQGRSEIEAAFAAEGLSMRDYLVLVWIDSLDAPSQQQIADHVGVDRSDFVKVLDQLQSRGLIGRERDTADRRRHVLSVTETGRAALTRATTTSREITAGLFSALTPAELVTLHQLALKALGEDPALAGGD